ncbi:MAG: hypothetical protein HY721_23020, partial [Planctomycetes bacterium]|nr:hypothetical protein [Planctomycetota bacterium]
MSKGHSPVEAMTPEERDLTREEAELIAAARRKAFVLYEGKLVPHRSCGIALAETFNLPTRPYQALRRGGITGEGECGAIKAGELVLGEYLGDPDPAGAVTPRLRAAAVFYRERWRRRVDLGPGGAAGSIACNALTAPFGDFRGADRQSFCTSIAAAVAEVVAETLVRFGAPFEITPIRGLEGD